MTAHVPTIETERLVLRQWREGDLPRFAAFQADPALANFVGGVTGTDDAWRKMAMFAGHWHLRGYGVFAVEDKATRTFAGYAGPWNPHGWPEPEIAWGFCKDCHGKGFATEAALAALRFAYGTLGWTTAISCIALDNTASRRVAERLGAAFERTTENRGWTVGIFRHRSPAELN